METIRDRLSRRLRGLMEVTPALDTQVKVSKRAGVSQSTVQRILSQDAAATIDVIELLARAFSLKPPYLLLAEEAEGELIRVWLSLNEIDRSEVVRFAHVLSQRAARPSDSVLEYHSKRELPPQLHAATLRAASRPSTNETEQKRRTRRANKD